MVDMYWGPVQGSIQRAHCSECRIIRTPLTHESHERTALLGRFGHLFEGKVSHGGGWLRFVWNSSRARCFLVIT